MRLLDGVTAIVTGGSSGIGLAITRTLLSHGANVAAASRTVDRTAVRGLKDADQRFLPVQLDLRAPTAADELVHATVERFGGVDAVVNNAASFQVGSIWELPDQAWREHLELKFLGYIRVVRAARPHLVESTCASVVNIAGNAARNPSAAAAAAGPINAAVSNLTRMLATDLARHGVTVNTVHPGATRTPRHELNVDHLMHDRGLSAQEAEAELTRHVPLGRLVEPDEVAHLVAFLTSRRARAVTGQAIAVDGGVGGTNY